MDRPDLDDDETGPIRRITDEVSLSPGHGASGTPGTSRKPARRAPAEGTRRTGEPDRRRADTGPQRAAHSGSLRIPAEPGRAATPRR
ncbi:YibE/F family protein, partial [Amycolatopsis mediterranei]